MRNRLMAALLLGTMLFSPAIAVAASCWNDCTIEATEWMNENNKSYEEGQEYFEQCLADCEGGGEPET